MKPAVVGFYWKHIAGARRVLDIGCGAGDLGMYGPATSEVWGIEINRALVEQAKRFESVKVWDLDSADSLPFADVLFDAMVAKDVLEHLAPPWQVLREVRRVLKPGGSCLSP